MPSSSNSHFFSENRSELLEKTLKSNLDDLRENLFNFVLSLETVKKKDFNKNEIKARLEAEFKLLTALSQMIMRSEFDSEKKNSLEQGIINLIGGINRNFITYQTNQAQGDSYFNDRYQTMIAAFSDFRVSTQSLQNDLIATNPPLFSVFEKVMMALASVTLIGLIVVAVQYTKRKSEVEKLQQSLKDCVSRPAIEMGSVDQSAQFVAPSISAMSSAVSSQFSLRSESPTNVLEQAQDVRGDDSPLEEGDDDVTAIAQGNPDLRLMEEEGAPIYFETLKNAGLVTRSIKWYPRPDGLEHFNP